MGMPRFMFRGAPVLLVWLWGGVFSVFAQIQIVNLSSPSAKYVYTFSGNPLLPFNTNAAGSPATFQFGATGVLTPGAYSADVIRSFFSVTLDSQGVWIFRWVPTLCCQYFYTLIPSVSQVPGVGTTGFNMISFFDTTLGGSPPGSAPGGSLIITPVAPNAVPAPGTLLLVLLGFAGLGALAPKLRSA